MRKRLVRVALVLGLLVVTVVLAAGFWLRSRVRASLPQLAGEQRVVGLASPVRVERDSLGVPTLTGDHRADVALALGFLHAQDRFFQMDTLRRAAAGELAEVFGPAALGFDRGMRLHRLRVVADQVLEASEPDEREILEAYAIGVNEGLAALGARPFEYLALRGRLRPWQPRDTVLVLLAMFADLQDDRGERESTHGILRDVLPPALTAFLWPAGTPEWDAPVRGGPAVAPPVPGPDVVDLRLRAAASLPRAPARRARVHSFDGRDENALFAGSNAWALGGARTVHGGAIVANDMHLGLAVPTIWYRASLVWSDAANVRRRITGVTLPGAPAVIVGSNGTLAWGFTNSYADWSDLVELELDPADSNRYRTPTGFSRFDRAQEIILVRGASPDTLVVRGTIWGPVLGADHRGRLRALRWVAHDPAAVNFHLLRMESAEDLQAALDLANTCGIPGQNFVVGHRDGRVGWTLMGRVPRRVGFDGSVPESWADGSRGWRGYLGPGEVPRIVGDADDCIWTANARVVDLKEQAALGDGGYALGARARQIRDDLAALAQARETDMLAIQLDDRALFLARWRRLLLAVLDSVSVHEDARRGEVRRLVEAWEGRASVTSVGYRLTRAFRGRVRETVLNALTEPCREADPEFDIDWLPRSEAPVWAVVSQRPAHLLPPGAGSWDELLLAAVDAVAGEASDEAGSLDTWTWGQRNTTAIRHPLARAVPLLGRWLNMEPRPLPGDTFLPRVQAPSFGASERMVVAPGRESEGIFHMPCGQSGHPSSPHFRDGERAWEEGWPTAFLPGPPVEELVLRPAG